MSHWWLTSHIFKIWHSQNKNYTCKNVRILTYGNIEIKVNSLMCTNNHHTNALFNNNRQWITITTEF